MKTERLNTSGLTLNQLNGLEWYLEARNWGLGKILTLPHGSNLFDIQIFHYVFLTNLISAVEFLSEQANLILNNADKILQYSFFDNQGDYNYANEFRNSIIHRGFDPAQAGHSDNLTLRILCPKSVTSRKGTSYPAKFTYTSEFALQMTRSTNEKILQLLTNLRTFSTFTYKIERDNDISDIRQSTVMPEWAKIMELQALNVIDYSNLSEELTRAKQAKLKSLLTYS